MNARRFASVLCAAIVLGTALEASAALRQYYSPWTYHAQRQYFYRTYYYKPHADFTGYNYHFVIYYPDQPDYAYFFNPYKKVYWGRCQLSGKPGKQYSLLAPGDRRENLKEIPNSAFPAPGRMPPIPESTDNVEIEPPQDLPKPEK